VKEWFLSREPRERLILIAAAIIAAVLVLWLSLRPLRTQSEALRASVASKQRLLVNLQQLDGTNGPSPARPGSNQTLAVLIDTTAKQHGVDLTRSRADGPDGVQVTFGNAPFDTLMAWLVALEAEYGVAVESAQFTSTRQQGIVNGQVLLRRP
jgi:type II secretory pathway component PulM